MTGSTVGILNCAMHIFL